MKAVFFAFLLAKPGYWTFSLSFCNLDQYLNKSVKNISSILEVIILSSSIFLWFIPKKNLTTSKNQYHKDLFKMTQAFFLVINTTIAELEKYCCWKNTDTATLLPEKCYKYPNIFSKKKLVHSSFITHMMMLLR